jgi:small-conductance mechanosensitive channel
MVRILTIIVFRKILILAGLIGSAGVIWVISGYFPGTLFPNLAITLTAVACVYLFVQILLADVVFRAIRDAKTRYTVNKVSSILAVVILAILLARIWVLDTASFLVSLGVLGAGLAISLQDAVKNFVGGFVIIAARLYEVGDRIEIGGETGDVIDIGVMNSTLLELDGWVHGDQPTGRVTSVPNGKVITQQIHNYTKDHNFIWEELTIPITYDSDWKQAKEIILTIARKETATITAQAEKEIGRLGEKYYFPRNVVEPSVYLTPTDNWITFNVRYVADARARRQFRTQLYEMIIDKLQEVKEITIASGTLTVTLAGGTGPVQGPGTGPGVKERHSGEERKDAGSRSGG